MKNRTSVFAGITAAVLLVAGVAWAASEPVGLAEERNTGGELEVMHAGAIDDSAAATDTSASSAGNAPSTTAGSSTSTSIDAPPTTLASTTSTSQPITSTTHGTTSTTLGTTSTTVGSTSTTLDDNRAVVADGVHHIPVAGAATVTVEVSAGRLVLVGIDLEAGWSAEIDKADPDDIRVEFESGTQEAELRVKIRDGSLRIETRR